MSATAGASKREENTEESWDDWVEDGASVQALFSKASHRDVPSCLLAAKEAGFDLLAYARAQDLDFYGRIRLVNYIRREAASAMGEATALTPEQVAALVATISPDAPWWADESLLRPALEGDRLLQELDSDDDDSDSDEGDGSSGDETPVHVSVMGAGVSAGAGATAKAAGSTPGPRSAAHQMRKLREHNEMLQGQVAALKAQLLQAQRLVTRLSGAGATGGGAGAGAGAGAGTGPEVGPDGEELVGADNDTYYFNSYGHIGIHEEMLKDAHRTETYRDAMLLNAHLFRDKVVLDIGCGTGILSMFAARAGAKRVIAVDNSDIIHKAKEIVTANGLNDVITLVQGKLEQVTLPVDEVDVIVSEWMGYALLYESMLDAVLFARSKWLVEGGHVLPNTCRLYLEVMDDSEFWKSKQTWWSDVYGFDMGVMAPLGLEEPIVDVVPADTIASDRCTFKVLDLNEVTTEDLDFEMPFTLTASREGKCHALVISFDTDFFAEAPTVAHDADVVADGTTRCVTLSTKPSTTPTHWKQTLLLLKTPFDFAEGQTITGRLHMIRDESNPRQYRFHLVVDAPVAIKQSYHMS